MEKLLLLAVLALLFGGSRPSAPPRARVGPTPRPQPQPQPQKDPREVNAAPSFTGSADNWIVGRFTQARAQVVDWNPQARDANESAAAAVAHWGMETNWGKAELDFNVGNLPAVPGQSFYRSGGASFAAFRDASTGIAAYFDLLRTKYAEAWNRMLTDPEGLKWFDALRAARYPTGAPGADYAAARKRVDAVLFQEAPAPATTNGAEKIEISSRLETGHKIEILDDDEEPSRPRMRISPEQPA